MSKIIAIVGKPNVGKSTFFNRLLKRREAIISNISGVTRDRNYGKSEWNGVEFSIIDTGGYVENFNNFFNRKINEQVCLAAKESSLILFLVDAHEGVTPLDYEIKNLLRKINTPVFLVVNKIDTVKIYVDLVEFYELGYEKIYYISSITGSGTGDLLDDLIRYLSNKKASNIVDNLPKIVITGRPNVGKSTLVNVLLQKERSIVDSIPGTTRDSIHDIYNKFGYNFVLVDTAGIRKKNKIFENIEFYSVMRSIRSIEYSDVVVIMVDALLGWESQDTNIFRLAKKNKKGILIIVNKWDLLNNNTNSMKIFEKKIKERISPFIYVPILFISALNQQRIFKVVESSMQIYENRKKRIQTSEFNKVMSLVIQNYAPPSVKGKCIKIKYCTQLPTSLPQFVFFCNFPQYIKQSYKQYIENQIYKKFNFLGVPIDVYFRKK